MGRRGYLCSIYHYYFNFNISFFLSMERRRLNLSLDHATYTRAETLATRLGFRSACSMARALLRVLVTKDRQETGEGSGLFEGFEDFEEFADWDRLHGQRDRINNRN